MSVCSGIESFSLAVREIPGWSPVAFAEIEAFPANVLRHHYPDVPNLGDMTAIDPRGLGPVDWLVGGTPCQAFSTAGLRRGLDDPRGNLTLKFVRLAHELKDGNGLRGLLWENVPGCLSDRTNAFGCLLAGLVGNDDPLVAPGEQRWPDAGMVAGPRARLAWRVLNSQHFGVPQRRNRVFLVADFGNGPDPAAVLFEPRGQGWRLETSGQARQDAARPVAPGLTGSARGTGRTGESRGQDPLIVHALKAEGADGSEDGSGRGVPMVVDVAPPLRAGGNDTGGHRPPGSDVDTVETLVAYLGNAEGGNDDVPSLSHSNTGKHVNNQTPLVAVYDPYQVTSKTNRSRPSPELAHAMPGQPSAPVLFAFGSKGSAADAEPEVSPPVRASGHRRSRANSGAPPAIAFQYQAGSEDIDAREELSPSLKVSQQAAVAFNIRPTNSNKDYRADEASHAQAVIGSAGQPPSSRGGDVVTSGQTVRRLTPRECERLQGVPDDYTLIPGLNGWRYVGDDESLDSLVAMGLEVRKAKVSGRWRVNDPDGPRYRALGNAFTVNVVRWIMRRATASLAGLAMPPLEP